MVTAATGLVPGMGQTEDSRLLGRMGLKPKFRQHQDRGFQRKLVTKKCFEAQSFPSLGRFCLGRKSESHRLNTATGYVLRSIGLYLVLGSLACLALFLRGSLFVEFFPTCRPGKGEFLRPFRKIREALISSFG